MGDRPNKTEQNRTGFDVAGFLAEIAKAERAAIDAVLQDLETEPERIDAILRDLETEPERIAALCQAIEDGERGQFVKQMETNSGGPLPCKTGR